MRLRLPGPTSLVGPVAYHGAQALEFSTFLTLSSGPVAVNGSPSRSALRLAVLVLALLAINPPAAGAEGDGSKVDEVTLASLLAQFSAMPGLAANVREERRLKLLKEPLVSEGTLYYAPPGRLARHIHTPFASRLVVLGERVQYGTSSEGGEIELGMSPALRSFVEAFRLLLSGDVDGLEGLFAMQWTPPGRQNGSASSWHLSLSPKEEPLSEIVRSLEIRGHDGVLSELSIREVSGDRTDMTFSEVDPGRRFSEEEAAAVFRLAPP